MIDLLLICEDWINCHYLKFVLFSILFLLLIEQIPMKSNYVLTVCGSPLPQIYVFSGTQKGYFYKFQTFELWKSWEK